MCFTDTGSGNLEIIGSSMNSFVCQSIHCEVICLTTKAQLKLEQDNESKYANKSKTKRLNLKKTQGVAMTVQTSSRLKCGGGTESYA